MIRDAFPTVKTAKCFGTDNIFCFFLKLALSLIENSYALLFNISMSAGQFPDSWKIVRVALNFKEGERTEKSNYKPISTLPVITRPSEKLITNQLYQYIDQTGLFQNTCQVFDFSGSR